MDEAQGALTQLRAYLAQQDLHANAQLPPEREFCEVLGVSRGELRKALAVLEENGELWRHVGKGTFVGTRPFEEITGVAEIAAASNPREVMHARLADRTYAGAGGGAQRHRRRHCRDAPVPEGLARSDHLAAVRELRQPAASAGGGSLAQLRFSSRSSTRSTPCGAPWCGGGCATMSTARLPIITAFASMMHWWTQSPTATWRPPTAAMDRHLHAVQANLLRFRLAAE